jgi:MFS family permease
MEVKIWSKIGKILLPVLFLTFFLNFFDAFFWTIGPLVAESLAGVHRFAGLFMVAYTLPALLVGWFVGVFTRRFGKKHTAFMSLFVGSLLLSLLFFIKNPIIMMVEIFVSSLFMAMSWPAINGTYADYISETVQYEKEIEGLEDFYTNLGYIFGPIISGFVADRLGNINAFVLLGLAGILISITLLLFTPKKIVLKKAFGS